MLRKSILITVTVAALAALVLTLRPSALLVTTAEVSQGPFSEYIEEEGRTRLLNTYNVSTPIQGFLQRVTINPGDRVEAGQVLFILEPIPTPALDARSREQAREALSAARSRLTAAQAQLEQAEAEKQLSQRESDRVQLLAEQGLVSLTELDRATAAATRAAANARFAAASVESARHDTEAARILVDVADGVRDANEQYQLEVRSPISGVALRRERCCEGVVMQGQRVLELGNMDELEMQVDLLSSEAVRVEPGMPVEFTRWGGEGALRGRVRRVDPAGFTRYSALGIEEQRVSVFVSFTSEQADWNQLGEGYRVEARIQLWQGDNVTQIPISALFRHHDQWHVFVVKDSRAHLRAIEPGRRSGLIQQVNKGLEPGERVITHPAPNLSDGQRVRVQQ